MVKKTDVVPSAAQCLFKDLAVLQEMAELRSKYVVHLLGAACGGQFECMRLAEPEGAGRTVMEYLKDDDVFGLCVTLDCLQACETKQWIPLWKTILAEIARHGSLEELKGKLEAVLATVAQKAGLDVVVKQESAAAAAVAPETPVGDAAGDALWVTLSDVHHFEDDDQAAVDGAETGCGVWTQSADAQVLGGKDAGAFKLSAPFMKKFTAHLQAKVGDFFELDQGLDGLRIDLLSTSPAVIAREVSAVKRSGFSPSAGPIGA